MATIAAAETISDSLQAGGYRLVYFRFMTDQGDTVTMGPHYPQDGTDLDALRAQKGAELLEMLAQQEIAEVLGGD